MDLRSAVKTLRSHQQSQISKLQLKTDADLELLDHWAAYIKKRAEVELAYSQSLEKLAKNFSLKKFKKAGVFSPSGSRASSLDDVSNSSERVTRVAYHAFSTAVAESEKLAQQKAAAASILLSNILEIVKDFHKEKVLAGKRNAEFATKYLQELWAAYDDLDQAKHQYDKSAKEADSTKRKYEEALKKPQKGLLQLVSSVSSEERVEKLQAKSKVAARKLVDHRNDYLLSLASVNSVQKQYYERDLPNLLEKMDQNYYRLLSSTFEKLTEGESALAEFMRSSAETLRVATEKIDRKTDEAVFLEDNADIFRKPEPFAYDKNSVDELNELVVDDVSKVTLGRRLANLLARDEDIAPNVAKRERELAGLQHLTDAYTAQPSFGSPLTASEQRLEIQNAIDLLQAIRTRISSQIAMLKGAGVEPVVAIQPSTNTSVGAFAGKPRGVAIYDYAKKGEGEANMKGGDQLVILEEGHDGWIKIHNLVSQFSGLVPSDYVEVVEDRRPSVQGAAVRQVEALYDYKRQDEQELSFKAGDTIHVLNIHDEPTEDAWWDGRLDRTGETGAFPVNFTRGWQSVVASFGSSTLPRSGVASPLGSPSVGNSVSQSPRVSAVELETASSLSVNGVTSASEQVRVIFPYDATCDGELTLRVGEIINIITKQTGSDAWWEGQGPSGRGQFPVNFVEPLASSSSARISDTKPARVKALYDYSAGSADELTFRTGDIIELIDQSDPDWWEGELHGNTGAMPANYVEMMQ
ncbi:F-BAR and double SH3 domains protein 1 [Rhizophlyctis rosea]|nr:F-BAR and double SH3 domains protein 1 [Rhizophlyctis rosea]